MKKLLTVLIIFIPCSIYAQLGIKAGFNFANVTKASSINNSSHSGFNIGIFLAPSYKKILSSKTELVFSRQGYNYKTNTNTGKVNLDYIMLPQYLCINITKYFQIHVGAQMAYLLNAKADSTTASGNRGAYSNILNLYNRFEFGVGGGVEVHPYRGLLIGARMNVSLGNLYQKPAAGATQPGFVPAVNIKNNLFQLYTGWRFGKKPSSKK